MNIQKEIEREERYLKVLEKEVEENIIISQLKSMEYEEEIERIKNKIQELRKQLNSKCRKEWRYLENGWRERIYIND